MVERERFVQVSPQEPSLSKITLTQAKDPIIVFFSHES